MSQTASLRLSICIATLNRGHLIASTLERLTAQLTHECELVIVDGASTDNTQQVVAQYAGRYPHIRYIKQDRSTGLDRDFDRAVELARGEYCWLMSDDDFLKAGGVSAVLHATRRSYSLIVVNADVRDVNMSRVLLQRFVEITSDRIYTPKDMDSLFAEAGLYLSFIGGVIIRRTIWLARKRQQYYGSLFIHVGVIFQERLPADTLIIAEPLISIRYGNNFWRPKVIDVYWFKWPSLVWSLLPSDWAKRKVVRPKPWEDLTRLLMFRAMGAYSLTEYSQRIRPLATSFRETLTLMFVAALPSVFVKALLVLYYSLRDCRERDITLYDLRQH